MSTKFDPITGKEITDDIANESSPWFQAGNLDGTDSEEPILESNCESLEEPPVLDDISHTKKSEPSSKETTRPVKRFDSKPGRRIDAEESSPTKRFDSITGKPIKPSKSLFMILVAVLAGVAVIGGIVFGGYKAGIFFSKFSETKKISESLPNELKTIYVNNESYILDVESVEVEKRKTDKDVDTVYCTIILNDENYQCHLVNIKTSNFGGFLRMRSHHFFVPKTLKILQKTVDKIANICCASLDYKHISRRRPMAQNFLSDLKITLDNCIAELDEIHFMFCQNPEADFTRNRKLSFHDYIQLMLQMQSKSVSNEILDFFDHSLSAPSKSAFTQQRFKLQPEGWHFLFHIFVARCRELSDNLYQGYRLLACDGSDVNIARNPDDERTFINEGEKGYNAIHINALYDITNRTYCDFLVQGKKKLHERAALNTMIDRYSDSIPAILMADRGYESFNVFAHLIKKNMKFVIRIKDINSNGILSAYNLPDGEFDTYIKTTLTRRHTKETLGNPNTYTILQPVTDFDFFAENCVYYDIEFRIVRILLDNGTYISIATNLPKEDFPLEEIKKLYRMRWSEETSFRELKYTIGLINWHSSKYDGILQEINARMILYNFCELVTAHAVVKTRENTKHSYKINFATAVNICRAYLKHGSDEIETMHLIQKHLTPVRSNRKYPINLRPKRNRDFMYRAA